ncbi:MAG: hypothetical protein WKG01_32345 [Kofleriaceae bacterium]
MISSILLCALAGCADDGDASYGDELTDPQLPPRGSEDVVTWLEAGHYLAWNCEPEPHPARPPGAHGRNRICTNNALSTAPSSEAFPVGAAAVKELVNAAGGIELHAVYRKVTEGTGGDTWYWFEGAPGDVIANGEGHDKCVGCHGGAPRDFVFTVVAN